MTANPEVAREAARTILREFGVKGAPVPVERIIKARNVMLQYAPLEDDLSGMAFIKDGVGIIGVNALHHPNRQRFTAAHELGHHVLHASEIQKAVHVDKGFRVLMRDDVSSQGIDPLEVEANAFASELLMPRELLASALDASGLDMEDDAGIEALAKKFRVSASAMRFRLAGKSLGQGTCMGFVFFDTETTGLRHGFDQIVHFAAIRTDNDLNETDRFEVRSRLLPHVVPHPSALLTNRLPIERLTDGALPSHYDMVKAIQRTLLAWSPSVFVGYNSIRFDEEMLRHALFQTLHPAYLTSNNGNCRADALGLMMAAATLSPACLVVPLGPEGRPTFRLDQLASANDLTHDQAHDAMADVVATLGLCRFVRERAPELWQRFIRFSKKATVGDFVEAEDGFFLTEFFSNQAYHAPVVCLGPDPDQPNGRLCLRLDVPPEELALMPDEALQAYLSAKPCPVRRLRINASPTLTAFYDAPDLMLNGADVDELEDRARRLKEDAAFRSRIISLYVAVREPYAPSLHVEGQIYNGFIGPDDERRIADFHDVSWLEALSIVRELDDERLRIFGRRLIYFGGRSVLPSDLKRVVERDLTDRLADDAGGNFTLQHALQETERLLNGDGIDAGGILVGYHAYLIDRIGRVTEFRAKEFAG